ncbi:MAG: PDZ domain-containing protein [Myxococcota bacterium]
MTTRARSTWAALGGGVVGAGLAAAWLGGSSADAAAPNRAPSEDRIAALEAQLEAERDARLALAGELQTLRAVFLSGVDATAEAAEPTGDEASAPVEPERDAVSANDRARRWFDDQALRDLELAEAEIASLRTRFESLELEELYLRDRASREGWLADGEYWRELIGLRKQLREDVGERDYDLLLYAGRRENRVVIADVLGRSPAGAAGLQIGDEIVSYAGRRVFEPRELTESTSEGAAGANTELRVRRGGETLRFFVPRGPLGLRLKTARRPPSR